MRVRWDGTVSLVSPSFMRRMNLAASRFLSRLQSSLRDTKPARSIFSVYCDTQRWGGFQHTTAHNKQKHTPVSHLH